MIAAYVLFLLISAVFFSFTSGIISNKVIRFVISAAMFFVLSVMIAVLVSRGHAAPPGAKTVDIEEMKKIRMELNKDR